MNGQCDTGGVHERPLQVDGWVGEGRLCGHAVARVRVAAEAIIRTVALV